MYFIMQQLVMMVDLFLENFVFRLNGSLGCIFFYLGVVCNLEGEI
jgi:Na+-translocating ferredoxin:NAD+ oxidoreductase RnfE subunit